MIDAQLHLLEHSDLIRRAPVSTELEYWFKHGLVQESAYDSLLNKDRKRLHLLIGQSLERAYPQSIDELAPLLAQHWDVAGDAARAFAYYVRAGDVAARTYALPEALMAYQRAFELSAAFPVSDADLLHLYLQHGRALELRGTYTDALKNYAALEAYAQAHQSPHLELPALIRIVTLHATPNSLFDLPQAKTIALRALALARTTGDRPAEAQVLWTLLLIHHFSGEFRTAVDYGEQSLALARELNLREQMAYTLNDLVRSYTFNRRVADAVAASAEAATLWRELDNRPMLADNLSNAGTYAFLGGKVAAGIPMVQEALHISLEIGNHWGQAYAQEILGFIYFELGESARALDYLARALENGMQVHFVDPLYSGQSFVALIYQELGMPARGIEVVHAVAANTPPNPSWLTGSHAALAMLLADTGDRQGAEDALAYAQSIFDGSGDSPVSSLLGIAEIYLDLLFGRPAQAISAADRALLMLETYGLRPFRTWALTLQGMAQCEIGDLENARLTLMQALDEALADGNHHARWRIFAAIAVLERACGNNGEIYLAQARAAALTYAEHAPSEFRESFLQRPAIQALFAEK